MAKEKSFKDYISGKDFGEFNVMSGPDPTFFGVLHKYSDELSQTWRKESTRQSYASYYKRHILPELNGKALKDCELEDFERLFDSLPNRYKSSTIDSIRHLVGVVLEKAAEKEICPNVLWGTRHTLTESDTTLDDKEFVRLKKSLSIPQELSIASEILANPMQRGEHMGLALMFCLGARNSEACGANFGDFIAMQSDPSQFCLLIDKTTVRGGSELQTGGKTRNTPRLIPCPSALMRLIDERKRALIDMVASHPENFNKYMNEHIADIPRRMPCFAVWSEKVERDARAYAENYSFGWATGACEVAIELARLGIDMDKYSVGEKQVDADIVREFVELVRRSGH